MARDNNNNNNDNSTRVDSSTEDCIDFIINGYCNNINCQYRHIKPNNNENNQTITSYYPDITQTQQLQTNNNTILQQQQQLNDYRRDLSTVQQQLRDNQINNLQQQINDIKLNMVSNQLSNQISMCGIRNELRITQSESRLRSTISSIGHKTNQANQYATTSLITKANNIQPTANNNVYADSRKPAYIVHAKIDNFILLYLIFVFALILLKFIF